MKPPHQVWVGGTDLVYLLREVGGWHVGSARHREAAGAVGHALRERLVGYRVHHAPAFPEGVSAFELTDKGIDLVRKHAGEAAAHHAAEGRRWYRERTAHAPGDPRPRPGAELIYHLNETTIPHLAMLDDVGLRFSLADRMARLRYGDTVEIGAAVVMKCWPPTGEHDRSVEGAARALAIALYGGRPETSLTSVERIKNDLPDDGSYAVRPVTFPRAGIAVARDLYKCPRCRGRGIETYYEPQPVSAVYLSAEDTGITVLTRECDHVPREAQS
jgi:hypothetical protein